MGEPLRQGSLLVASSLIDDGCFYRSVILLAEHLSDGSWGVILNQPTDQPASELCPELSDALTPPDALYYGGPVGLDSAVGVGIVKSVRCAPPGTHMLGDGVALVDLEAEPDQLMEGLSFLRIYGGYAGWREGQLESELSEGAWHVVDAEWSDFTSTRFDALWSDILRRQPAPLSWLASYPDDVREN